MKRLQELAENYLNGMVTADEYAMHTGYMITQLQLKDVEILAFLISYGEMPQPEYGPHWEESVKEG